MKKYFIVVGLLFISLSVFAQSIDKSQYKEIDLFSYKVEGNQKEREYPVIYKMVLKYWSQSGTTVNFEDDAGDMISLQTTKRWTFNRGQVVTVYFTARHSKYGSWLDEKLDDIETSTISSVKPWLPYVSNGKTNLHGWYLQDMGNGTYKEVYFE
ncbi:MAG: hypothetical protein LBS37_04770 [Treponema sp.]|jgi:hypothetical protein|nr:hypothetical protein [Treponema sp.]